MLFGDILKTLRESKNLKQDDIAKFMNVDRSTVGKWESSSSKPDYEKLVKLANFYGVTTDYLLGHSDIKNPYSEDVKTIAAHKEGEYTEEELEEIERFKEFVKSRRQKQND